MLKKKERESERKESERRESERRESERRRKDKKLRWNTQHSPAICSTMCPSGDGGTLEARRIAILGKISDMASAPHDL